MLLNRGFAPIVKHLILSHKMGIKCPIERGVKQPFIEIQGWGWGNEDLHNIRQLNGLYYRLALGAKPLIAPIISL